MTPPRQIDLERQRAVEAELRELRHAIAHPTFRIERDQDGRIAGVTPAGIFPQSGITKKVIRRDERGRIAEILHVAVTNLAEQIAELTRDHVNNGAVVSVSEETFAELPRSTDVAAILIKAERLVASATGKTITMQIAGPCEMAAENLYAKVRASLASLQPTEESTITVDATKLPHGVDAEKITHALAALIGKRHPAETPRVRIVLETKSATPSAATPPKRHAGFRPHTGSAT